MKSQIRKQNKIIRKSLPTAQLSIQIKENLFSSEFYKKANNIFCFYSFTDEVDTLSYFSDKSKNWFIPKVFGEDMLVCPYSKESMSLNKYGIYEPDTKPIENIEILDLVIIPALAVDKNGYRIGYGKGYYDRFLSNPKLNIIKVVPIFSKLIVDNVYPEKFDIPCNHVVTEDFIINV